MQADLKITIDPLLLPDGFTAVVPGGASIKLPVSALTGDQIIKLCNELESRLMKSAKASYPPSPAATVRSAYDYDKLCIDLNKILTRLKRTTVDHTTPKALVETLEAIGRTCCEWLPGAPIGTFSLAVTPPGKQTVPGCSYTYAELVEAGWKEEEMVAQGFLEKPKND
jgi:hypothetical protein